MNRGEPDCAAGGGAAARSGRTAVRRPAARCRRPLDRHASSRPPPSCIGVVLFADMLGKDAEHRALTSTCSAGSPSSGFQADVAFQLDQLSMTFVLLITGVGSLIHMYSVGYMEHDERPPPLLRLSEPVPRGDAAAGPRRQLPAAVRRLGGRRSGVVPADRLLAAQAQRGDRGQEGVPGQPRRRHGPVHRDHADVRDVRDLRLRAGASAAPATRPRASSPRSA